MADRDDGDAGFPALAEEDDWFRDPFQEPLETDEIAWQDDVEPPPPPPGPPGLGERQAVVVLAVVAIVVVIAVAILVVRAFGGSDGTTTTTTSTQTTPAASPPAPTTTTDTTPTTTTPTTTTPSAAAVPTEAVLKTGSEGSSVEALQLALADLGYEPGAADGKFGAATAAAVTAFQTAEELKADGIAGPETLTAINAALANG